MKKLWGRYAAPAWAMGLPRLLFAGIDEASDTTYYWRGSERGGAPWVAFQYTLGGRGRLKWSGGTVDIGPGEAFCYSLADPDYDYFYPPDGVEPWSFVYGLFEGLTAEVNALVKVHGPVFRLGDASLAVRKVRGVLEASTTDMPILDAATHFELCAAVVEDLIRSVEGGRRKGAVLIRRAVEQIQSSWVDRPFDLAVLARQLSVTPEHLCRVFRSRLGITPKGYHDELRLNRICDKLLNSPQSLKEIAAGAGFVDPSHFNKFFKAHRGVPPGEFRYNAAFRQSG